MTRKRSKSLLFAIDDTTVPDGGTRPDRALAFARRSAARGARSSPADVALISDGEGLDPRADRLAGALAREGRRLHTLFVSARAGVDAVDGVRRAAMSALAAAGGGRAGDAARPQEIAEDIAARGVAHIGRGELRALEWRDYGRFLAFLAAAPLLLACAGGANDRSSGKRALRPAVHRAPRTASLLVRRLFPRRLASRRRLDSRPPTRRPRAADARLPSAAAQIFADPAWTGVAFYEAGRWREAAEAFARDSASAYDLGNALALSGRYAGGGRRL